MATVVDSPNFEDVGEDVAQDSAEPDSSHLSFLERTKKKVEYKWQNVLDQLSPMLPVRWALLAACSLIYTIRVYYLKGFYIVTYGLCIFLLNLLIGFLTPLDELELSGLDQDGAILPTGDLEYRPLVRRLPEFKFWYACIKAIFVAFSLTFFSIFNVPVFWPILLIYFIILFTLTMKKQLMHMWKYKYNPCDICQYGKKQFGKGERTRVM